MNVRIMILTLGILCSTISYSQQLTHRDSVAFKAAMALKLGINMDQDYHKAGAMFSTLGKKGYADAWGQLGDLFARGLGCQKNEAKAFKCYLKGNKLGSEQCALKIAHAYRVGKGVSRDYRKAFEIADSIAKKENRSAFYQLGEMYYKGLGVEQNYIKAIENFSKGAKANESRSLFMLAICYAEGNGVSQNIELAQKYFTDALAMGHHWVEDVIERNSIDSVITIVSNQIEDFTEKPTTDNLDVSSFDSHQYWKGTMNIYDWSGKYIRRQRPVYVQILPTEGNLCMVNWRFMDDTQYEFAIKRDGSGWHVDDFKPNALPDSREIFTAITLSSYNYGSIKGQISCESLVTGDPKQPVSFELSEISEDEFYKDNGNICITKVYPNPVKDRLRFYFTLKAADAISFSIYDASGMLVKATTSELYNEGENIVSIDVSNLRRGNYVVEINGRITKSSVTIMKVD